MFNITDLTATKLNVHHSKGIGLLGVNIFGASLIQQAVFVNNTPNCAIVFVNSYYAMKDPVLYIADLLCMSGRVSEVSTAANTKFARGLTLTAIQTTYHVKSYIKNVTTYRNTGYAYGNMLLRINCNVAIHITQVNCTGGYPYGLVLNFEYTHCKSDEVTFIMSNSYFDRNGKCASLYFPSIPYSVHVKLENITVKNNSCWQICIHVYMTHSSILLIKNVNFHHNTGALSIISDKAYSLVEFQGSNTFVQNNGTHSTYPALRLQQCNVTLHGNATFLQNKGWYGGAIYAEDAEINFQGNLVFLENEAR